MNSYRRTPHSCRLTAENKCNRTWYAMYLVTCNTSQDHGGAYLRPIPGCPNGSDIKAFCRKGKPAAISTRCARTFGWSVLSQRAGVSASSFRPQQIAILSRLALRSFPTEVYDTSRLLRCCSGRRRSKFHVWGSQHGTKNIPHLDARYFRTATVPHMQPQPAKTRHALD